MTNTILEPGKYVVKCTSLDRTTDYEINIEPDEPCGERELFTIAAQVITDAVRTEYKGAPLGVRKLADERTMTVTADES